MDTHYLPRLGAIASACLLLAACGGSGSGSNDAGKLSLSITDAPIYDAQTVKVNFTGVEVKPESGAALRFNFCEALVDPGVNPPIVQQGECTDSDPSVQTIDLLEQTGGASALLLDGVTVPAGRVNWVRLLLAADAGTIKLSTGSYPLTVPSGDQTGLKLNRGFIVPADGEARIYIDFDVRKSIVEMHSGMTTSYKLKPTLRLVEDFGAIAGEVDPGLLPATCLGPSIYVFAGAGATPDDIERDPDDPLSSAMIKADITSTTGFSYRADFLAPGDYTVAFVCADGGPLGEPEDDPDVNDTLSFIPPDGKPATVVDDQTTTVDF